MHRTRGELPRGKRSPARYRDERRYSLVYVKPFVGSCVRNALGFGSRLSYPLRQA